MAGETSSSTKPKLITILSIDGGGVRGLIPATILNFLELELQKLDGEEARIADYFDVIAGVNTGGWVATMLSKPNENNRPNFSAKDIKDFFFDHFPKIFPQHRCIPLSIKPFLGPKYNGHYLHKIIKEKLGETKLHQLLTKVVIPTIDIKQSHITTFSTYKLKEDPSLDALVSDICISTTATPIYLPAYYFKTEVLVGTVREFNLVDVSHRINNPTSMAVCEAAISEKKNNQIHSDSLQFVVLSLGAGSAKEDARNMVWKPSKWDFLPFFNKLAHETLKIEMMSEGNKVTMHEKLYLVLEMYHSKNNYLRIQHDDDVVSPIDLATKENLDDLVEIGEKLLKKKVSNFNLETGELRDVVTSETNEEALIKFAKLLSQEKKARDPSRA